MSNLRLFESKKAGFQWAGFDQAVKAGFYPLSKIRAGFQKAGRFSMVIRVDLDLIVHKLEGQCRSTKAIIDINDANPRGT